MNTLGLFNFLRRILFAITDVALVISITSNISIANAKSVKDVSQTISLSSSDSCSGPVVYLSGATTSLYNQSTVANGTTFNRTGWYSDAVGTGSNPAFSVGYGNPPPYDVCVFRGVINGHIPLDWSFATAHDYAGSGDKVYSGHLSLVDGVRVHNVVDGWKPRELPEFGNTGVMLMRNAYMTGIRDDAIENDDFMPGWIENSLFDGVRTFLSEQNQSESTPVTIGPNEDPYIRLTQVYVRLYPTNSNMTEPPNRWFKWMPRGTINHKLIITDSVFATGNIPDGSWSQLSFPDGTTFQGTNYILWLGTPGVYQAAIPPGVTFLEGQAAVDKWNQVRNSWLVAHGYNPRPVDDFNPMDDMPYGTFADVWASHPYYQDIEILYANGLTGGCNTSPLKFCPDQIMDRAQAAVFMVRGAFGSGYVPNPSANLFQDDWTPGTWARPWAESMRETNLTTGCKASPLLYCPWVQLPREQVVIFGLKMKYGNFYQPPPATGTVFADMANPNYYATAWAEKAYADGLITNCGVLGGKPKFCPSTLVTRGLGAYVIVRAKNLTMP